jgi:hypothetical protein
VRNRPKGGGRFNSLYDTMQRLIPHFWLPSERHTALLALRTMKFSMVPKERMAFLWHEAARARSQICRGTAQPSLLVRCVGGWVCVANWIGSRDGNALEVRRVVGCSEAGSSWQQLGFASLLDGSLGTRCSPKSSIATPSLPDRGQGSNDNLGSPEKKQKNARDTFARPRKESGSRDRVPEFLTRQNGNRRAKEKTPDGSFRGETDRRNVDDDCA